MQHDGFDDEALDAALRGWQADEEREAYRIDGMLDDVLAGRTVPTGDDAQLFVLTQLLREQTPFSREAEERAFTAMMTAVDQGGRDPARIEQTRQAMLRAHEEAQRPQNPGGDDSTRP